MSAPTYNAATDTLVYVGDSNNPTNADMTAIAATPLGTAPRIITNPSPVSPFGGAVQSTQQVVTGKGGVGKALSMMYPAGDQSYVQSFIVCKPAVPPTDPTVTHYVQFAAKFLSTGDGTEPFPIKFFRFPFQDAGGSSAPQWDTHWWKTMQFVSGAPDHHTYWEYVAGGDDPEKNQGMQPVPPYYVDILNSVANDGYGNFVVEYRAHSTEKDADGVTPSTFDFTPTSPGTLGSGGTAVFKKPMAGKIMNGQIIGAKAFMGSSGNKLFGGWTVSAFDGDRTCTLTPVQSAMFAPAAGTVTGIKYSLTLDGCARLYLNGSKILDVSAAAFAEGTPPGGDKPWCSKSILSMILTDSVPVSDYVLWFGGSHSSNVPTCDTTMILNIGDGVATNPDTLAWWTTPYSASSTATQLLLSQQPAGAVSGIPMSQQPVVRIADAGGATVTSDTSTVTAQWVSLTGDATPSGTLTKAAVSGVATFTDLGLAWTVASTGKWRFTDGSLTLAESAVMTLPVAPLTYVPIVF